MHALGDELCSLHSLRDRPAAGGMAERDSAARTPEDAWTPTGTRDPAGADATGRRDRFDRSIHFRRTRFASSFSLRRRSRRRALDRVRRARSVSSKWFRPERSRTMRIRLLALAVCLAAAVLLDRDGVEIGAERTPSPLGTRTPARQCSRRASSVASRRRKHACTR